MDAAAKAEARLRFMRAAAAAEARPDAAAAVDAEQARLAACIDKVHGRLCAALGGDEAKAARLESCLWAWCGRTCARDRIPHTLQQGAVQRINPRLRYRYTTRALSLAYNLRHPKNPALGDRVRAGEVPLKRFANMTPQEMWPELYAPIYQRIADKMLSKMAYDLDVDNAPDGAYTCGRCKSKKTQYTCLQTRSADEPMTIFVACLKCGRRWKD